MAMAETHYCTCCAKKDGETPIPDSGHKLVMLRTELEHGTEVFVCPKCDNANLVKIATSNHGPPVE